MDNEKPVPTRNGKPLSDKQLATLRAHAYPKGVSGNQSGVSLAEQLSYSAATNMCRELACSPLAVDTITRLLRNKRNPKLQLAAWIAIHERAYGAPVQITTMEGKLSVITPHATPIVPFIVDPSDPQQLQGAITVAKGLADLLASTHPPAQPPQQLEPRDKDHRTLPETMAALPPAPADHGKVIAMRTGPERFNGAGARLEVISDAEQEKFRQKPLRG